MLQTCAASAVSEEVAPGEFTPERHYYPRALNAQIHPAVDYLMRWSNQQLATRYRRLHPEVDAARLDALLSYQPRYFAWAGADLFHVTTGAGTRQMVLVETNSCPSGHKSMPLCQAFDEHGTYRSLIERSFLPRIRCRRLPPGGVAVIYDKNPMEASGYAATLADCLDETVHLASFHLGDPDPPARFSDGVLEVRTRSGRWLPMRAAFRYVTQKPWNRIPIRTRTLVFNPVLACLAGGRNKSLAAKAYAMFNAELAGSGLRIRTPETIWNVSGREVPHWFRVLGGLAVAKIPYSNAGQGVFTLIGQQELDAFMERHHEYDQLIVQSLIGNCRWSSTGADGRLYHVGTLPDKKNRVFAADIRMMVGSGKEGFRPLAIYGRRARSPLVDQIPSGTSSWSVLGTNLSCKRQDGSWDTDTSRLLLMDQKDFVKLGLGIDEVIEAYVQTVLATIAIDRLAAALVNSKGELRRRLFASFVNDRTLSAEICR